MDYQQILSEVIKSSKISIIHGKTIVFIWENEDHLLEWYLKKNVSSECVKIAIVLSEFLPTLSTGSENHNDVCIRFWNPKRL